MQYIIDLEKENCKRNKILKINKIKEKIKENESLFFFNLFNKKSYKIKVRFKFNNKKATVYSEKRKEITRIDKSILKIINKGYKTINEENIIKNDFSFCFFIEKYKSKWILKIIKNNEKVIIVKKDGHLDFNGRLMMGIHDSIDEIIGTIKSLIV